MRDARCFPILLLLASTALALPACSDGSSGNSAGAAGAGNSAGAPSGGNAGNAGNAGASASAGSNTGGASASGGTGSGGIPIPTVTVECQNHIYQCGDLIDNDMDGLLDYLDPDCLGPCDDTEDSFYGGIPGQSGPACEVDCYFDQDSGSGNDDCHWSHMCDPNEQTDPGHPEPNSKCKYNLDTNIPGTSSGCEELKAAQSDTCYKVCGPLTPNGCDCFGCCELPAGSGKFVWLGSEDNVTGQGSCTLNDLADPDKCEPCIVVPSCYNDCGKCELCIGKKPEDIPPECNPGGGGSGGTGSSVGGSGMGGSGPGGSSGGQCEAGLQPCGLAGQKPCGADFYCISGCCQPIDVPK